MKDSKAEKLGLQAGNKILMIDNFLTINISEDCVGYLNGYEFKQKEKIKIKYLNTQENEKK
ncbi:hypothetical protein [Gelatiniphilus marinus]|uniref:SpoVT-AbrB domain-containing protein n=1 Tax=Gelatiniphilus marinus TaxID=1759464 RepID=A0ABW5JXQ6_9FLAO